MEKSKILFVLDDDILNSHHGVRRYALSLAEALGVNYEVEFYIQRRIASAELYFKVVFNSEFILNNGFFSNYLVGTTKDAIIKNIISNKYKNKTESLRALYTTTFVGNKLPNNYCLVIVAAPWIIVKKELFDCKVTCIGLDAIPNIYSLHNITDKKLREFAWRHQQGFNHYDLILAISEDSKNQISYFCPDSTVVIALPPFNPSGFNGINTASIEKRPKSIILAAPFDERKGLQFMPDIINNSDAESLIIYGGVRCSIDSLLGFFKSLNLNNVEWWYSVTTRKQIEIYSQASLLLFPSLKEGLGLPVLESLACNTPAFVSDIEPVNTLVPEEYVIDAKDYLSVASAINAEINSDMRNEKLNQIWQSTKIIDLMNNVIKN